MVSLVGPMGAGLLGARAGGGRGRGRRWLRWRSLQKPRCGSASPPPATRAKASFCSGARRKSPPSRPRPRARRATSPAARRRSGCLRPGSCRGTGPDARRTSVGQGWPRAAPVPVRAPWSPVQPAEVEVSHPVGLQKRGAPEQRILDMGVGHRRPSHSAPSPGPAPCPAGSPPLAGVPAASFFPSSCPGSAACSQPELAVPSPPPASGGGGPIPQPSPGGLSLASGSSLWDFPPPVWTLTGHSRSRCPCPQSQAAAPSRWGCSPVVLHLGCPLLASAVPLTLLGPKSALRPPCPGRGPLPPRALRATGSEMPLPTATVPSWRGGGVTPGTGGGSAEELAQALEGAHGPGRAGPGLSSRVRRYIQNPLLLDGKKFDVRAYLLIACAVPYMVFFGHGYARLTLGLYDPHSRDLTGHLTNQVSHTPCSLGARPLLRDAEERQL